MCNDTQTQPRLMCQTNIYIYIYENIGKIKNEI